MSVETAEKSKSIVGKPYTAALSRELERIVDGQEIDVLTTGSVRSIKANTTYVVTDAAETVVAVICG